MKKNGFTLIELLAVIIILAIIALISVPVVTGIIKSADRDSKLRSAELYIDAVNLSIMNYNLTNKLKNATCEVKTDGNLDCDGNTITVSVQNTIPTRGMITIENRKVSKVVNLKLDNNYYSTNENGKIGLKQPICILESDSDEDIYISVGDKYTCTLDHKRTFYVLGENENDSSKIDLIMDRNYIDSSVPIKMSWCDPNGEITAVNTCKHNNLDPMIEHIQDVLDESENNAVVSLPSKEQILNANNGSLYSLPIWLYDYLDTTQNRIEGLRGYWTSTPRDENPAHAWFVFDTSNLDYLAVAVNRYAGIRPVITVSKINIG